MKLYDQIIRDTEKLLGCAAQKRWDYSPEKAWAQTKSSELVLTRDAAYELGGDGKPSANYSCITEDQALVPKDEILLYGRDLSEINEDVPYARIALMTVSDMYDEDEELYKAIRDIEFVKYRVFPKGYMLRTSPESSKEQVRVDKSELHRGMSFEAIGAAYIQKYKENPRVKNVRMIFITDDAADYAALLAHAREVDAITKTLTHILEGFSTDCSSCKLKSLCDEVEGMRELHFKRNKKS